jgi:hypothetical protein
MKCKDVLDKKLPVAGENEITWHELKLKWNVRLLSIAIAAWWKNNYFFIIMKCEDVEMVLPVTGSFGSEDLVGCFVGSRDLELVPAIRDELDRSRTFMYDKGDWSLWWVLSVGWHEDMIREWPDESGNLGIWNSMTWESVASLGTGMASDGNGGEELNAIR